MFAEITIWGWFYSIGAVLWMMLFSFFCIGFCGIVLIELPQWIFKKKMSNSVKEGLMFVCVFIGLVTGMLLGGFLELQLAIWLGFRQGDLPTLPQLK